MSKPILKYQFQITQVARYDWSALVVDATGDKPSATTILAKSLAELLTKCTVAVMLREKNIGAVENAPANGDVPIVLTPSRKIVTPPPSE